MSITERQSDDIAAVVDDGLLEIDSLWRAARDPRGPGGSRVTEEETENIEAAWRRFRARAGEATQTLKVIRTASSCHRGVCSDGFIRIIYPLKRSLLEGGFSD